MAEGEVLDLKLEDESFGENDYFKCIYKKTASLFAISASIGLIRAELKKSLQNVSVISEMPSERHTRLLMISLNSLRLSRERSLNSHPKPCRTSI